MSDTDSHIERTIADMVAKIDEDLRPITERKKVVNQLCEFAGLPLRYTDVQGDGARGSLSLRRDQFHKKPLATAVREYLELRGRSDRGGLGAATVNEIFDALIAGGYQPETTDEENAKRGLRIALTKNSVTFYRIAGGTAGDSYGLLTWYPNAKPQTTETAGGKSSTKGKRGRPPKTKHKSRGRPRKAARNVVDLPKSETATSKEAAASELRKPRGPDKRGGTPKTPERKEEPDVAHQPDITGPVKTSAVA
jgi:hypothetical protein